MSLTPTLQRATPRDRDVADTRRRGARRTRARRTALHVTTFVVLLATWWVVTRAGLVRPLFLPSPGDVWDAFVRANSDHPVSAGSDRIVRGEQNYYLWEHLVASLQRIAAGVGGGILVGVPLGLVMGTTFLGTLLEPYLNFLRSLPPLAYIGLLIVWFGIGDTSKVWLLFLAAFPPITMATMASVRGVREDQVNAALSLGARRAQTVWAVVLPSTLPDVLTGIRVATGFAWTTVVAAEIANGIPGIGGLAYLAGEQLRSDLVVACIFVIGLAAIVLDLGLKSLERALVPWRGKA
ncbi:ABC transporter permease [Nocardioides renjunii]|uniref:ABC transporter permease n=1 Tax=Nocardioides renjunii TaxID=3095075 RepID=UPI002AFF1475|nr:ABC transporter permease subunit [Nocardioides sp. S-34]WQQ22854.1 ABC transporter permease subunit [Nocardioides sp. S-34]